MKPRSEPAPAGQEAAEAGTPPEVQQGSSHGPAMDERLKRQVRQHPQRDEPRVDSVEPGETPR